MASPRALLTPLFLGVTQGVEQGGDKGVNEGKLAALGHGELRWGRGQAEAQRPRGRPTGRRAGRVGGPVAPGGRMRSAAGAMGTGDTETETKGTVARGC